MFYNYLKLILFLTIFLHAAPELYITYGEQQERFKKDCQKYKKASLLPEAIKNKCDIYISKANYAFKFGYKLDHHIANYTLSENQKNQYLFLLDKLNKSREDILGLIYFERKKARKEKHIEYYQQLIVGVDVKLSTLDYEFMNKHKAFFLSDYRYMAYQRKIEKKQKLIEARRAKKEKDLLKAIESFKEEESLIISTEEEEITKAKKYAQDIQEIEEAKKETEKFNERIGIRTKTVEKIKRERREKKYRQKARVSQIRQAQKKYSNIIMSDCQRKWGTDYNMVEYCVNKQTEAHNSLSGLSDNVITRNCRSKWGTDYSMVKYCVDKQYNAYQNISSLPDDTIMSNCRQKWGTDFSMIKYCVDKQTQAKRSLGL